MKGLSKRQKSIVDCILKFQEKNGVQPSCDEISKKLKLSRSYVVAVLKNIEAKGLAKRMGNRHIKFYLKED